MEGDDSMSFVPGDSVEVLGIIEVAGAGTPKHMLNGKRGVVLKYNGDGHFAVKLESGEVADLRPVNLALRCESGPPSPVNPAVASGPRAFDVGNAVEIVGLESERGKLLNRKRGEVVRFLEESGRYEIRFALGGQANVKEQNLKKVRSLLEDDGLPTWTSPQPTVTMPQYFPGDAVQVFGLTSEKGRLLNDDTGIVASFHEDTGRYDVRFVGGKTVSLKTDNMKGVELTPPDFVKGLKP